MHLADLQAFLSELSENNQRAWMAMNKPRYDILRKEFLELTSGLIESPVAVASLRWEVVILV